MDVINHMRRQRDALILAHNYQLEEVQNVADLVGDSYALSKTAALAKEKLIILCGVHFMAESAAILSPDKTILLPAPDAGCPLADTITPEGLQELKNQHPGVKVVVYINSSAAVKAVSDICCTSSNAVKIVRSIPDEEIIFVPDKNLGNYVQTQVPEKRLILWPGSCITHDRVKEEEVNRARKLFPDAQILVHPECAPNVVKLADFVGSTSQIIEFARKASARRLVIGTEMGTIHRLRTENPKKEFYTLSPGLICPNMKKTTLNTVLDSLLYYKNEIKVSQEISDRARTTLEKMLQVN
ncbi:MAG: quinolinate synthase NadA [Bacillota bacterium]